MSGPVVRARLENLDTGDELEVQFNPVQIAYSDRAVWRPDGLRDRPPLAYEQGRPATLRFELTVDTTRGGEDAESAWVGPLRALLDQSVEVVEQGARTRRPPRVRFVWGPLRFVGVVETLDVSYTLFRPDGAPLRASVRVGLLEHGDDQPGVAALNANAAAPPAARPLKATLRARARQAAAPMSALGLEGPARALDNAELPWADGLESMLAEADDVVSAARRVRAGVGSAPGVPEPLSAAADALVGGPLPSERVAHALGESTGPRGGRS